MINNNKKTKECNKNIVILIYQHNTVSTTIRKKLFLFKLYAFMKFLIERASATTDGLTTFLKEFIATSYRKQEKDMHYGNIWK
jgi:hypothetical protein